MTSFTSSPILVVGAGPVGLTLAVDLARRKVPVRIIDALPVPTTESRAIVIHARSLDQLEIIGALDELLATGIKSTGTEFHSGDRRLAHVPLDTVDSRHPFSFTTAQTETERVLTERLSDLGVKIERGTALTDIDQDARSVRAKVRRAGGSEETIDASWLVGTDGAHGSVRKAIGQKLEGSFKGENLLMGDVDADFEYDRASFHIFFSPGDTSGLLFPMLGRRARVFAQIPEGTDAEREPSIEWMREALAERGMKVKIESVHWLTRFEIHHAQVARYRVGRVFLAGDAAHVHSPAGGQGMNTGMQDALNLSWKLALASRGRASDALLDSYHEERHPIAAHVIAFTTRLTKVGALESSLLRAIRNDAMKAALRFSAPQRAIANEIEEQNVHYRKSSIVAGGTGSVRAGDFLRDGPELDVTAALRTAATAETVRHVGVLVPGADGQPPPFDLPGMVKVIAATEPARRLSERFGFGSRGGLVLVRPDGYVGLVAEAGKTEAIGTYFGRITVSA